MLGGLCNFMCVILCRKSGNNWVNMIQYVNTRCVAQFGRALRSGRRGRRFESCRTDF